MISTLSAYKEMILASASSNAGQRLKGGETAATAADPAALVPKAAGMVASGSPSDAVSVELSASHDVFNAVDSYFNLGRSGRFDDFHKLSREDKEQFVKIMM